MTNDPHLVLEIAALVVTILLAIGGNLVGFAIGYIRFKSWAEAKASEEALRRENDAKSEALQREHDAEQEALRWQQHLELESQRWEAFEKRADERWELLEKRTGVTNGDGYFVPTRFCAEVHRAMQAESAGLRAEVREAIQRGEQAITEGREDRQAIRDRLAEIEAELHARREAGS